MSDDLWNGQCEATTLSEEPCRKKTRTHERMCSQHRKRRARELEDDAREAKRKAETEPITYWAVRYPDAHMRWRQKSVRQLPIRTLPDAILVKYLNSIGMAIGVMDE